MDAVPLRSRPCRLRRWSADWLRVGSDAMQQGNAADPGEAQALEQAEADCARQRKHAVSQRSEGETIYDCSN